MKYIWSRMIKSWLQMKIKLKYERALVWYTSLLMTPKWKIYDYGWWNCDYKSHVKNVEKTDIHESKNKQPSPLTPEKWAKI